MPLYTWRCSKCQTSAEVFRTFDEYQLPPNSEEYSGSPKPCDHDWSREIGKTNVVKGGGWGGGKGYW